MLRGRTKERFGVPLFATALPCHGASLLSLADGREPHEYQASCVGGQMAGGGSVKSPFSLGVLGERGRAPRCFPQDRASYGGSVRAVERSDMDLVWTSKEGISSLTNASTVHYRREGGHMGADD
jgi:hypothetical protein